MKEIIRYSLLLVVFLYSCSGDKNKTNKAENLSPEVMENGNKIVFPSSESISFFETENISSSVLNAEIVAPAKVAATVIKSEEGASQDIILFENSDLAGNYTQLIQHLINIKQIQDVKIKQRQTELDRIKDMQQHGAASGKDLLDAQTALSIEETNLANERAAIIEHETKLKSGGFRPELLTKAKAGTAYVICDIPENRINKVIQGSPCTLQFTSFPDEKFTGKIDEVADMVDQTTRMVKLRVSMDNSTGKIKAGMFAMVSFGINEGNNISVSKNSVITIQGKNYVFVKSNPTTFVRKEVKTGNQIGDRIIVYSGINNNDAVAIKGVMQLKGLSFGY